MKRLSVLLTMLVALALLLAACAPAATPTEAPPTAPAAAPTEAPTMAPPTEAPTMAPPTEAPTEMPTEAPTEAMQAPSGEPIVIGASLPLSGRFSEPGTAAMQGYETWADIINASGGLLGRPVELSIVDNASDQDTAVADYEKLITVDKVDLVVGPFSSFLVIPTSEVAARYWY
jgi:ABC-type branched-subunit amino acid transport system substrate-binding protein